MIAFLEQYRPLFLTVTLVLLGLAFYLTYRPRAASGSAAMKTMMRMNKVVLWAATLVVLVFLFVPQAMTNLLASPDGFTKDMERTVIAIEGMT